MIPPSSGAAGINELEGSVLLEADDYLRVCHDVKALKTSLLRLKREIQTDVSGCVLCGVGGWVSCDDADRREWVYVMDFALS